MEFYKTLKKCIFIVETLMGILFLFLAMEMSRAADLVCHSIFCQIPTAILTIVGIATILFGLDAMLLQDDPDVWR
jgi:hypothetical protein